MVQIQLVFKIINKKNKIYLSLNHLINIRWSKMSQIHKNIDTSQSKEQGGEHKKLMKLMYSCTCHTLLRYKTGDIFLGNNGSSVHVFILNTVF
jgi:hypothetical protein